MRDERPRAVDITPRGVAVPGDRRPAGSETVLGALFAGNLQCRADLHRGSDLSAPGSGATEYSGVRSTPCHQGSAPLPAQTQAAVEYLQLSAQRSNFTQRPA